MSLEDMAAVAVAPNRAAVEIAPLENGEIEVTVTDLANVVLGVRHVSLDEWQEALARALREC